jgi:hypothetical protein
MQANVIRNLTVRGQSQGMEKVESDLNKVSAAQEKVSQTGEGMAKTTEASARRQLSSAKNFDRLIERSDRMVYLQRQLERELMVVNRAFESGHITVERRAEALALVQGKHERLVAAETRTRAQLGGTTSAMNEQTAAAHRLAAANDNLAASSNAMRGNSANIAAQFQDVGVTAAMGMNPIMIALQQGTQLSAVLNSMENPIRGLGTALVSILNPVSLATIGFVALTATAIQFFTSANDNAKDATTSLEKHREWLDKILEGYDRAQGAAADYREEAGKLPEASVASDIESDRVKKLEEFNRRLEALAARRTEVESDIATMTAAGGDPAMISGLQQIIAVIDKAGLTASSSADEFAALDTALTLFKNSGADDNVVYIAEAFLALLRNASDARVQVGELDTSLRNLPTNVETIISVKMEAYNEAQGDLLELMPDFRDRYTRMRDQAEERYQRMLKNSPDDILRRQADQDLQTVLGGIDRLEVEENARRASRGGGEASPAERWQESAANFQQRIEQQRMETGLVGQSTMEIERQRAAFELLNQARQAGIPITATLREQVDGMAQNYAAATVEMERMTERQQQIDQINSALASSFSNLFMGILDGSQSAEDGIKNLLRSLTSMAMNSAFQQIMSGGEGGGGGIGGWITSLFQPRANARGGLYDSPSLSAWSNQMVDRPTLFTFANGGMFGLMGEAGTEAIMPVGRDRQGRLGVHVAGESHSAPVINFNLTNASGQPMKAESVRQSRGPGGEINLDAVVVSIVNTAAHENRLTGIAQVYGLQRKPQS